MNTVSNDLGHSRTSRARLQGLVVDGRAALIFLVVALHLWTMIAVGQSNAPPASPPLSSNGPVSAGTMRMAERMRKLNKDANPLDHAYLSHRVTDYYKGLLRKKLSFKDEATVRSQLPRQSLNAGRTQEAIQGYDDFDAFLARNNQEVSTKDREYLLFQRALCHLRLGEQQNCQMNHNSESCLFPILPSGVHRRTEGSREAIRLLTELAGRHPDDLSVRWLLNIACMTLGEYPHKVPTQSLIPPSAFAAEYDIKRFPDVAGLLGVDVDDLAGGSIVEDFDGDGNLDILASCWRMDGPIRFFRNDGKGRFIERTKEAGLGVVTGGLNIQQTDYNNDGYPDVFILRGAWLGKAGHQPNSLLRNNGDGTFSDVTEEAGLLSFHPTQAATWFDFNNDGWLDVFIANESFRDDTNACELYRNNGDGTFTECAAASGVALVGFFKGVGSGDYDNDGRPDLFLSNREGGTVLLHNDGLASGATGTNAPWHFTDVTRKAGIPEDHPSFSTWFFDYDNDGWLDIFCSGYSISGVSDVAADYLGLPHHGERAHLYHNNGDGTFTNVAAAAKVFRVMHGMGANFGDLDNDGWLDFYMGTGDPDLTTLIPNRMFRNAGGKFFQEVTASGGFGHLQKGHGVSFADIDNDGDQDIYAVMGGAYSGDNYRNSLFLNPGHGNHWIGLKIVGVKSNRAALGARIKVVANTSAGTRDIYKTVNSGGSFGSSPFRQQLGLGQAKSIERVEIFWPTTGKTQVVRGLDMDHFYQVREDATEAVAMELKPIKLDFKGGADPLCAPPLLKPVLSHATP